MFMNAGQALGPMIGAFLFGINLYVPWYDNHHDIAGISVAFFQECQQ